VAKGGTASEPAFMAKAPPSTPPSEAGLYLDAIAWYPDETYTTAHNFATPITGDLTLYAKWTEPSPIEISGAGNTLENALNYIAAQPLSSAPNYTILLDGNYSMNGVSTANINKENTIITLLGRGPSEITLSSDGSLFRISAGELILDNNITLKGRNLNSNIGPVIWVYSSASLTMKAGAKITGQISLANGGGVIVSGDGTFTMEDGEIFGNSTLFWGGGVLINNNASFIMEGGKIYNNTASSGGGVLINNNASFSKTGGVIYGSEAEASLKNTATDGNTNGHAVCYVVGSNPYTYYYRDLTLNTGDNISTGTLPGSGTEHNWTKK
jgi:uncharacterized repeat protein (TIGR02543 family)